VLAVAAAASLAALLGRRMRSAPPTIDPVATRKDFGVCEEAESAEYQPPHRLRAVTVN
jgi:hypothetical protein